MWVIMHPHRDIVLKKETINFALITVSSSRYRAKTAGKELKDDTLDTIVEILNQDKYKLIYYSLIPDSEISILQEVCSILEKDIDVAIFSGGTGPARTDKTVEVIKPLFTKELVGFGDIFRFLSYDKIGAAAYFSNATAGVISGKIFFILPGSPKAVKLALEDIILPEIDHLLYLIYE